MKSPLLARKTVTFKCYFLRYTFAFAQQMVYHTIKAIVTNMYKTSIKHVLYMFNTIMNLILASFSKEVFLEIISVNITKGGCGKTTTVQMLGEILGKVYGKKVLCIDTDPQCNLSSVSGINLMDCQEHNLYTLLKGDSTLDECILKSKYYDIIPGSLLLAYSDIEFNQLGREYLLKEKIEHADYDVVLIDTPPALGLLNIMSLTASTRIIIPTECSYLSMIGLDQLSSTIASVRKHSNTNLQISGILMVKYNSRTTLNNIVLDGLKKMAARMNTHVFDEKIRETVRVREGQSQCIPLLDWDGKCSAVSDYLVFTKSFINTLDL